MIEFNKKQKQIIELIHHGYTTDKELADKTKQTEQMVKWYLRTLFRMLDVRNKTSLVLWFRKNVQKTNVLLPN
jgi:DNA-binding NarL/FixJ family response regulator